jgi:hypothetical protein
MARGGKLEIVMDSVRLVDGERAALRAVKEAKGGGHTGGMVAGIVVTGLILWPAAPFFLFMHGKDITIPKGTELPTFVNGNIALDFAKFQQPASGTVATLQTAAPATIAIASTPAGAEIFVDQNFVGNAPSSIAVSTGKHLISVRKQGYRDWERALSVSAGTVSLNAELVSGSNLPAAESVASTYNPPQQARQAVSSGPQTERPARVDAASSSGWIGVTTNDDSVRGVVITRVLAGSPAEQAGLHVGDVIEEIDGVAVKSGMKFDVAIAHSKPGSQIRISYLRGAWPGNTDGRQNRVVKLPEISSSTLFVRLMS